MDHDVLRPGDRAIACRPKWLIKESPVGIWHRQSGIYVKPGKSSASIVARRLHRPEQRSRPSVFLSYAWSDSERVNKLDQLLRDHGVQVIRDKDYFTAGESVEENIARAISIADKIVAVLSRNSRNRDWPNLEKALAEQLESRIGTSVLIYLQLNGTKLPAHDSARVAISARGIPLKEVGERLLHAVVGTSLTGPHILI